MYLHQGRSNEFESGEATSGNLLFYTNVSMQVRDRGWQVMPWKQIAMKTNAMKNNCRENKFNVVIYKTRIELFMTQITMLKSSK